LVEIYFKLDCQSTCTTGLVIAKHKSSWLIVNSNVINKHPMLSIA